MGYVYFIEAEVSGLVKIGRAANPERRLAAMQTGSAEPLRLARTICTDDDKQLERDLHRRFAADRVRGEWFDPSEDLIRMGHIWKDPLTPEERRALCDSADAKVLAWRVAGGSVENHIPAGWVCPTS